MSDQQLLAIVRVLTDRAHRRFLISYSELGTHLECEPRELAKLLRMISQMCVVELGLPPLSALVVNAKTGIPGHGFYRLVASLRGDKEPQKRDWLEYWEPIKFECFECKEWDRLLLRLGETSALLGASSGGAAVHEAGTL